MSLCRPPQGQVGTGRVGTTGGWLGVGPGGQPHCTPSLALISAQCGAHSSRTALGVTRHASGHQTGSSFHLVQLWRGGVRTDSATFGQGACPCMVRGSGPFPDTPTSPPSPQALPQDLLLQDGRAGRALSRTAGQGGPSPGQWSRVAPLQNCGSRALLLQDRASPGALALPALSCLTHCPL